MNFLAHCALANDAARTYQADDDLQRGLIAGGVVGDFVKGQVPAHWPTPLQAGVRLHRKIDALSNQDAAVRTLSNGFPNHLRRLAPIFLDLIADHSLAKEWSTHYDSDRFAFSQSCYSAIEEYAAYLPDHGVRFLSYMREVDLLANYHQWQHVQRGTQSVLRRLQKPELLEPADQAMRVAVDGTDDQLGGILLRLRQGWIDWQLE